MNIYFLLAIFPSIVLHEVSHGLVANWCGDPTAKEAGRLTLNPLRHIDLFGTIMLPALMIFVGLPPFGYAKPVPISIARLRKPRQQSLYVSLAGPLTNLILCSMAYLICKLSIVNIHGQWYERSSYAFQFGIALGAVNITLAAFNLLPIPPLDGSALIERLVPDRNLKSYYRLRSKALPVLLLLILVDSYFLHWGTNLLTHLQTWWIDRVF
jgi:Zn-dependent protease